MPAALESHPRYLMLASGIQGLLSYSISCFTSLSFSISIDLVRIPCAMMPVRTQIEVLLDQWSANCLSASASSVLVVLILRSPLFNWFADATLIFSMYSSLSKLQSWSKFAENLDLGSPPTHGEMKWGSLPPAGDWRICRHSWQSGCCCVIWDPL